MPKMTIQQALHLIRNYFLQGRDIKAVTNRIVNYQLGIAESKIQTKQMVILMGYTHTGKTKLSYEHPLMTAMFHVDTGVIHRLINTYLPEFSDGNTITDAAYWTRQFLTRKIRSLVIKALLKRNIGIVVDAANLRRKDRAAWIKLADEHGYRSYIIMVQMDPSELEARLTKADDELKASNQKPVWLDLYLKIQKPNYEAPSIGEADKILLYESSTPASSLEIT
jgi:predicted kinase